MARKVVITYSCDRCGEQRLYVGEGSSSESREQALLLEGWTRITTGSITEHWEQARAKVGFRLFNFDLCAECSSQFSRFVNNSLTAPTDRVSQSNDIKV